jgi:hypothetical protein
MAPWCRGEEEDGGQDAGDGEGGAGFSPIAIAASELFGSVNCTGTAASSLGCENAAATCMLYMLLLLR